MISFISAYPLVIVAVPFGAVFFTLLGRSIGEKRRNREISETVEAFDSSKAVYMQRKAEEFSEYVMQRDAEFHAAWAKVKELGVSLESEQKRADYNDGYRKAIVELLVSKRLWNFSVHGNDAAKMLQVVIEHECKQALNPEISKPAKNLVTRGVRKANKTNKVKMAKLFNTLNGRNMAQEDQIIELHKMMAITRRVHADYIGAVHETMEEKLKLSGVRESFRKALNGKVAAQ